MWLTSDNDNADDDDLGDEDDFDDDDDGDDDDDLDDPVSLEPLQQGWNTFSTFDQIGRSRCIHSISLKSRSFIWRLISPITPHPYSPHPPPNFSPFFMTSTFEPNLIAFVTLHILT